MTATLKTRRTDEHALNAVEHFAAAFESGKAARAGEAQWLRNLREEAMAQVQQIGFPSARDEEWRFLDLRPLYELNAQPHASTREYSRADSALLNDYLFDGFDGHRLVFINGEYSQELSEIKELPGGATLGSLREHLARDSELVQENLARYADPYQDTGGAAFTKLNTAFFTDGAFLHLPNNCEIHEPIHLLFFTDANETPLFDAPRVLALAGAGSRATIIEHHAGRGNYFSNGVSEIVVGANAQIEHTRLQMESDAAFHVGTLHVQQARDCRFSSHAIDFGAKLARSNAIAVMGGQNIECTLNGLYVTRGEQVIDNHTVMDHAEPNCNSHEIYTGILGDSSRGIFNGKIFVRRDAQKTDAKQSNRNLLLSDDAQINTKPQLEIYADDVKCTHGATIGQLDDEALFYLRSRGIPQKEARALLIHAFAREAMEGIAVESVLNYLEKELYARLP